MVLTTCITFLGGIDMAEMNRLLSEKKRELQSAAAVCDVSSSDSAIGDSTVESTASPLSAGMLYY